MFYDDTVAAIATSSKNGSISIIRVSGSKSLELVSKVFFDVNNKNINLENTESHKVLYGFIKDKEETIDEVLVLLMKKPRSYTAEDVVEIQCHGGYFVCQEILKLLLRNGIRIAEPGEFTKRAFLNGRIDLSQAESVMDIINSNSKIALQNSLSQLRGNIKDEVKALREIILTDIAYLEAALDDPEHMSLDGFPEKAKDNGLKVLSKINHLIENSENGKIIKEGVRTTIVGKPNVGKSSFLNQLLKENRAIVTDVAGTTRDTLEEELRIGNSVFQIMDTAGIHNTEDIVEKIGVEKALESIEKADYVISIFDISKKLDDEDIFILEKIKEKDGVILLNKSDLDNQFSEKDIRKYSDKDIIVLSSLTGDGISEIENYLNEKISTSGIDYNNDIYITNMRQKQSLLDAKKSITNLIECIDSGMPEDLYSIDMYNAYEELGKIIGETIEDDIADKIFKEFCMGK